MSITPSLLKEISICNKCDLRKEAEKTLRKRLPKLKKPVCWLFYYSDLSFKEEKPDYLFIMQNPGIAEKKKFEEEIKKYSEINNLYEKVRLMREGFIDWMFNYNRKFTEPFVSTLKRYSLIPSSFMKDDFFKHFYVTDVVKCRSETRDLNED